MALAASWAITTDRDALLDGVTILLFSVILTSFAYYASYYARQELDNARERWEEANEQDTRNDADAGGGGWGREDKANSLKKFVHREVVISPELGRGCVVLSDGASSSRSINTGGEDDGDGSVMCSVVVEFDILNELRPVLLKDLLFVGMRLKHAKRGLGTIDLFDFEEERAHVQFDNGEYHRYLLSSWKSKMVARERYARKRKTFERFFQDYMFYRIDYVLSNVAFAKPALLSMTSLVLIIVGALLYAAASGTKLSESTWVAWTLVASSGSQAGVEHHASALVRTIAAALTLGGMLVFALVIGLMADGVSNLLDELKQGNALVLQTGHTLILGWSDKTIPVVRELCLTRSNTANVIVILAERAKADMELELYQRLSKDELQNTQILIRSGNPSMQEELNKVCAGSARSVIILADSQLSADESDARVVRCVLSLQGVRLPAMGHIVVEMCDVDNRDLGLLADGKNVEVVVAHDLIGRLMIQSAREPGLAHVLEKMLGFENQVLALHRYAELDSCAFGELLFRFEDAIPIGIKPVDRYAAYQQIRNSKWRKRSLVRRDWDGTLKQHATTPTSAPTPPPLPHEGVFAKAFAKDAAPIIDHFHLGEDDKDSDAGGGGDDDGTAATAANRYYTRRVIVNPPNDYVLAPGDEIMLLSAIKLNKPVLKPFSHLPKNAYRSFLTMKPAHRPIVLTKPERFLFCGWRRDVDDIILELDQLVCRGSEITILCDMPVEERLQRFEQGGMDVTKLKHVRVEHLVGNWTKRSELESIALTQYGSIFILADQSFEDDITRCDSQSLASLLFVRDIISKRLAAASPAPAAVGGGSGSSRGGGGILRRSSGGGGGGSIRKYNSSGSATGAGSQRSFRTGLVVPGTNQLQRHPHHHLRVDTTSFHLQRADSDDVLSPLPHFLPPARPSPRMSTAMEARASSLARQFAHHVVAAPSAPTLDSGSARTLLLRRTSSSAVVSPGVSLPPAPPPPLSRLPLSKSRMLKENGSETTSSSLRRYTTSLLGGAAGGGGGDPTGSFFVKRHCPVGRDLYFENCTGATILISEILDANTKVLIPGTDCGVGDYVMSNEAVACALAMVSECRDVNVVIHELLQAQGNDLHLRSALDYGFPGEKVDFWQLQARARARAEICIGYRGVGDRAPNMNPREKSAKITLHPKSIVIVLSEDNGGERPAPSDHDMFDDDDAAGSGEESDSEQLAGAGGEDSEAAAMERQLEKDKAAAAAAAAAMAVNQDQRPLRAWKAKMAQAWRTAVASATRLLRSYEFAVMAVVPVLFTVVFAAFTMTSVAVGGERQQQDYRVLAGVLAGSVVLCGVLARVSSQSTRKREAAEAVAAVQQAKTVRRRPRSRGDFVNKPMVMQDEMSSPNSSILS